MTFSQSILLPAHSDSSQPSPSSGNSFRADWPVYLVLGLLVILLAAFPIRNSDVWRHLAQGRELVQSGSFSSTWLFDLLTYSVYHLFGPNGLQLGKTIGSLLFAWCLLHASYRGGRWSFAVLSTLLVVIVCSPRFLVQPPSVSLLMLAVLQYLAFFEESSSNGEFSTRRGLLIVLLLLLWAQLDGGVLLGVILIGLTVIGHLLDRGKGNSLRLCLLLLGAVLVPMLNPTTWHLYRLNIFTTVGTGQSWVDWIRWPARLDGILSLVLVVGSALSFLLNLRGWQWQRFLPWLAFLMLGFWNVRFMPYFMVLTGPGWALNLQEWRIGHLETSGRVLRWPNMPTVQLLLVLLLLVSAWAGWLQATPYEPRRWGMETPEAPRLMAEQIRSWREERLLPKTGRSFHLSGETANVFAWDLPEDLPVLDSALTNQICSGDISDTNAFLEQLRDLGVTHLVIHDHDRGRLGAAIDFLGRQRDRFALLYMVGDVALYGIQPTAVPAIDFDRQAFGGSQALKAPREVEHRQLRPRPWWEALWQPVPRRTVSTQAAVLYLLMAESTRLRALERHLSAWESAQIAGQLSNVAMPSPADALLNTWVRLAMWRPTPPREGRSLEAIPPLDRVATRFRQVAIVEQDDTPAALLYLAIRACRRSIQENPQDHLTYLILGESYVRLMHSTRERIWAIRFPELTQLRQVQASTAFNQALILRPEIAQAHRQLSELYREMNILDLALQHLKQADRLEQTTSPELDDLQREIELRTQEYDQKVGESRVLDRALGAEQLGLGGKALNLLLDSALAAFGTRGMALQLDLMIRTGRAQQALEWMEPDQRLALGATPYHWIRTRARAALGDYLGAEGELTELSRSVLPDDQGGQAMNARQLTSVLVAQALLDEQPGLALFPHLLLRPRGRLEFQTRVNSLIRALRQDANISTLRGLLYLEEGEIDEAITAFSDALRMWRNAEAALAGSGLDFNAREPARFWLQRLE